MKKIITGIKATGNGMHIGNYFGAFKPFLDVAENNEAYIFIADYHSLTSIHEAETMQKNKIRIIKEYFALLPENTKITVFNQSKVKHLNDISWIISSVTPYSLMLRAHAFKDSQNKNSDINMATFNYPILMSADIISYDIDLVPVGKDQKQHIEFARDIAGNFNKTYEVDFFKLPSEHIIESVQTIPGTDGRKMSKSYNNFLGVFDDEKILKKKISSIPTGSESLEEPKNPETCNVFSLIKLFANKKKIEEIAKKYREGNYGYGHAKAELLELYLRYFENARKKYESFGDDDEFIKEKLENGNKVANKMVRKKYEDLMKIVGL